MIDVAAVAMSLALNSVEADRVEAAASRPVESIIEAMGNELAGKFRDAWDDPSDVMYFRTGKRMGKSEFGARKLLRGALLHPRSTNPYITPTSRQARLLFWPILKRVIERHVPDAKVLDHEMSVKIPDFGTIIAGGCECESDIGRWFGIPFAEAMIDECGTFPPYLKALVEEGIEPSTMDFGGKILLAGNPGNAPHGYWYDCTGPQRTSTVPLYTGDARENPFIPDAAEFFRKKLAQHGWTESNPTFRRMYLGEWANDPSALCFPYDDSRNSIERLPDRSLNGGVLAPDLWRWVIAADVAGVGITSIVVVCSHPHDPRMFVWSSESHSGWLPDDLVDRVVAIREDRSHGYDMSHGPFVVDVGGLGSVHALHLSRNARMLFEAAEKHEKKSAIRTTHDELLSGRIQVLSWHLTAGLRGQWGVLEWDADHALWRDGPPDHEADAALYGIRRLRHYTQVGSTPPTPMTPERMAERIKERRLREVRGARGRRWRER